MSGRMARCIQNLKLADSTGIRVKFYVGKLEMELLAHFLFIGKALPLPGEIILFQPGDPDRAAGLFLEPGRVPDVVQIRMGQKDLF